MCFAEYARTVLVAINRFCCCFVSPKSRFLRVECTGFYLVCTECTGMTRDSSDDRFSPEAGRTDRQTSVSVYSIGIVQSVSLTFLAVRRVPT